MRENDEDRLRHVLSILRIADISQGDGIDQADVPLHQPGKSLFRMMTGVFPQQVHVVRIRHLPIIPRPDRNWTLIFNH